MPAAVPLVSRLQGSNVGAAMKLRDLAALIVSLATLLGAIGGLWRVIADGRKDQAFAWDAYGDQVAEVERVKERIARVEGACKVEVKP